MTDSTCDGNATSFSVIKRKDIDPRHRDKNADQKLKPFCFCLLCAIYIHVSFTHTLRSFCDDDDDDENVFDECVDFLFFGLMIYITNIPFPLMICTLDLSDLAFQTCQSWGGACC